MKNKNHIIYILIIIFTFIMPIIPSTLQINNISLTGEALLYIIVSYFLLLFIFNKDVRDNILKNFTSFSKDYLNIFMLIWIITMFTSVIYSRDRLLALTESMRLSSYVFLFFILKYYIKEEKIYGYILKSYMLSSLLVGVYGIFQSVMGIGTLKSSIFGTEMRIASFLENANNLGMYFVFAIFPFIVLLIKDKNVKNRIFYFILTVISLANIVLSYSRNALLGFTFGIAVIIIILGIKYIYLSVIPVLLYYSMPTVSSRVKDITDMSQNLSRVQIWKSTFLMIKEHPVFGVGNGNYSKYFRDYVDPQYTEHIIHPHNAFLKAYSELGILGLLSFAGMIFLSFVNVYKFIRLKTSNFYNWFYTGVFISLFSMVFMNLIDSFFTAPKVVVYYFIVLGICEGIRSRS